MQGGGTNIQSKKKGLREKKEEKGILLERKVWDEVGKGAAFLEHHMLEFGSMALEEEQQE